MSGQQEYSTQGAQQAINEAGRAALNQLSNNPQYGKYYNALGAFIPQNAAQAEELAAAPEVQIPLMAADALIKNKKVSLGAAIVLALDPINPINLIVIAIVLGVVLGVKPFEKIGLPQTAAWNAFWILLPYFILAPLLNYAFVRLFGKALGKL
jgi:hypothetical protein